MARLTSRPSRVPSPTPDPQTDQENIDPQRSRTKGKQRAAMTEPASRQEPDRHAHKRRRITPEPEEEEDLSALEATFTKYFDPAQDPEERREVNRQQRELNRDLVESREELLADSGEKLTETVQRADKIFKNVKQTGDACVDSRFLVDVGGLAYKKSAALVSGDGNTGIDLDDFLARCISFMRGSDSDRRPQSTQRSEDDMDGEEDNVEPLNWDLLGRSICFPCNSRPPVPSFLLGPLSLEKKQRPQTQRRARQARNTAVEARPEALDKEDLEASEQSSLTAQCAALANHLKGHVKSARRSVIAKGINTAESASTPDGKKVMKEQRLRIADGNPGVPLFEYVINPHSFGQTIENLFHISFLIKEGSAGVALDDDGLPVLFHTNPRTVQDQREQNISKHQAVLSLDYSTWRQLIEAYDVKEPMIPHRAETQVSQLGARGWYT